MIKNYSIVSSFKKKLASLEDYTFLVVDILKNITSYKTSWSNTLQEMYSVGPQALLLIIIGGLFAGMILATEGGHNLVTFGAITIIGRTVTLGMIRELGPVITGLLLASRTGAKNTSEIGAMQLSEQIDALRAFGLSPTKKLVIPRVISALVMFLPLTLIADISGIIGGVFISHLTFHVDLAYLINSVMQCIKLKDLFVGCIKPVFFSFFISSISCYYGLSTSGGTTELGKKAISSVVMSSAVVLGLDVIFTKVLWEVL
jgi:phospholipid/cholesterol/gamma-HCH transport system permease protein